MLGAEGFELRHPHHGAVERHDLADDARGLETGEAGEVDRGLGLSRAHQHAAVAGAQGEHVTRTREVFGLRVRIDGGEDGGGAVGRGDSRGRALLGLDGHAECGAELRRVLGVLDHQGNAKLVEPAAR